MKGDAPADNLAARHNISPEDCFRMVQGAVDELWRQVAVLEEGMERLEALFARLVETAATSPLAAGQASGWSYDARQPNLVFADLLSLDEGAGANRRWVGASGVLATQLNLPRTVQYSFAVEGVDFARPEYAEAFHLRVGDRRYGWIRAVDGRYETIILEDPAARGLSFELAVAIDGPASNDVTFAFSRLAIARRD